MVSNKYLNVVDESMLSNLTLTLSEKSLRVKLNYYMEDPGCCSATIAGHTEVVLSVSFSSDGRQLASGSGDTIVRILDLNAQTSMFTCSGHKNWVLCIAWSPDGKHLVSGSEAGELHCWDPQTGKASSNALTDEGDEDHAN